MQDLVAWGLELFFKKDVQAICFKNLFGNDAE